MDVGTGIGYLLTALGGGGIVEILRGFRESRTLRAQAKRADVDMDIAVDKHHSAEEQRFIDNLVKDNTTLRARILEVAAERDDYRTRLQAVEAELIEVRKKVDQLQTQIHELLRSTEENL